MDSNPTSLGDLLTHTRRIFKRLVMIGENRFELWLVELLEERQRLMHLLLLAAGVAVFGLLAVLALSATLVVLLWDVSHVGTLAALAVFYGVMAAVFFQRLTALQQNARSFSATLEELKKDRACLTRE
jgi:uncharacterized membrane protein YqjE